MKRVIVGLILIGLAVSAHADPAPFVELEVRDDVQHQARLGGGVAFGRLETLVVIDPQGLTDGVFSTDVGVGWRMTNGAAVRVMARETAVRLDGRTRFFDFALIGGSLPVYRGKFEIHAGVQAGAQLVARGGDMDTQWFAHRFYTRSLLADLFVEVRYGRAR
jgi:hypothetical protein